MSYIQETQDQIIDLVAVQSRNSARYPYLLESVTQDNSQSQYSILFGFPQETLQCSNVDEADKFFADLNSQWQAQATVDAQGELPFTGGWFVYLGYEAAKGIESSLSLPEFPYQYPVAFATRSPACLIVDHENQQTHCICETEYADLMTVLLEDLESGDSQPDLLQGYSSTAEPVEQDDNEYLTGAKKILEYIKAGDVFQVNLSRAWQVGLQQVAIPAVLYSQLREKNPAPFACLVHHLQGNIISSSPERLVRVINGKVETRPIAGTRPRTNDDQDQQWLHELRTDQKEQAEHIMLIDLERNDLGRVCQPGSIEVDELMVLESYAHVHHIVSNISGQLREGITPVDVLKAVFPGGTITGCPKIRCMEIVAELEKEGRGPYTGSVGFINHNGSMDFNILIRTIFQQGKTLHFRAGAGIVADSVPEKELTETRHKAKGLLLSLDAAV